MKVRRKLTHQKSFSAKYLSKTLYLHLPKNLHVFGKYILDYFDNNSTQLIEHFHFCSSWN